MTETKNTKETKEQMIKNIWTPPSSWKIPGTWFWWFWLFFIHDEDTEKTGKCRQLMVLWSIKKDKRISCNSLDIEIREQLKDEGDSRRKLDGAVAAWYFDGKAMHDDFVLEKSCMELDGKKLSLSAPGNAPSSFYLDGNDYVTKIDSESGSNRHKFEFRAKQDDAAPVGWPVHDSTSIPFGMRVEGTRIRRLSLTGTEEIDGKKSVISGTAYFQKILVATPIPQWYWGVYHFKDRSVLTFMVSYVGRATLADNAWKGVNLRKPTLPVTQSIMLYHAPSKRVFTANNVSVTAKDEGNQLWSHAVAGKGKDFEIDAFAQAYSRSCWRFVKNVSFLPIKSVFKYAEYPAVLKRLELRTKSGEKIELKDGWGNMENSWGFLI